MFDIFLELIVGGIANVGGVFSALLCDVKDVEAKQLKSKAGVLLIVSGLLITFGIWALSVAILIGLLSLGMSLAVLGWAGHVGAKVEQIYNEEGGQIDKGHE